jgi:hypothetical protein
MGKLEPVDFAGHDNIREEQVYVGSFPQKAKPVLTIPGFYDSVTLAR